MFGALALITNWRPPIILPLGTRSGSVARETLAVRRHARDNSFVGRRLRKAFALALFAFAVRTSYAVVVAITEGTRGSDASLYWTSTALLVGIAVGAVLLGRRFWRPRVRA
jgi:polyferredoxin